MSTSIGFYTDDVWKERTNMRRDFKSPHGVTANQLPRRLSSIRRTLPLIVLGNLPRNSNSLGRFHHTPILGLTIPARAAIVDLTNRPLSARECVVGIWL
jgi:hypothetical protein